MLRINVRNLLAVRAGGTVPAHNESGPSSCLLKQGRTTFTMFDAVVKWALRDREKPRLTETEADMAERAKFIRVPVQ